MRIAILKAGQAASSAAALYREMAHSALRLVPGGSRSVWPEVRAALAALGSAPPL